MGSKNKTIPVYSVEIRDSEHEFKFQTEIKKLEKSVLLELPNPEYQNLQNSYQRLKNIKINGMIKKLELPVHVILGVNDYNRIKIQESPRVSLPGLPTADLSKLVGLFYCLEKKTLQLISCLIRPFFMTMKTYVV